MFDPQLTDIGTFLQYLIASYRVDPKRVYLTGLSSGGGGVYTFLGSGGAKGLVAAAIAICGNQEPYPSFVTNAESFPLWSFQNWGDPTNPRSRPIGWTTKIGQALSGNASLDVMTGYPNQGSDTSQPAADTETATFDGTSFTWASGIVATGSSELRLTLYPKAVHDAWTATYAELSVWDWLLAHGAPSEPIDAGTHDAGGDAGGGAAFDGGAGAADAGTAPSVPEAPGDEGCTCSVRPARKPRRAASPLFALGVALEALRRRVRFRQHEERQTP